ncbi:MAG: hypothetical protein DDT26_01431 [Dehalococcoidia bacterium]|nr:hypothetical protein [Chloroflexota bacterium]
MSQATETAMEVAETGLYIDEPGRTDLEFYNKLWESYHKPWRSPLKAVDARTDYPRDRPGEISQNVVRLVLHGSGASRQVIPALICSVDTTMTWPVPTVGSGKALVYANLIQEGAAEESAEGSVNLTTELKHPGDINQLVDAAFKEAIEQDFEDGMESEFSRRLPSLLRNYGIFAVQEIAHVITRGRVNSEVASEALRWLGRMDDPATHSSRLWLLEKSLASTSAQVRDGAALGLASMDDPDAIPSVKRAIERENYIELRKDMKQVLEDLEATRSATFAKVHT